MDLIRVDVQVVENCLLVKGVLSKWDDTQVGNVFEILLDTDMNTATGEFVSNDQTSGQPAIGADYKVRVYSADEYTHVGYYADLERPNGVIEPHDAIVFARPSSLGPASFTVTIPLEAISNPTPDLRLFVTTGAILAGRYDIAPPYPIIIHVTPSCQGDFDSDGDVDGSDLAIFAADFGRTDCLPENPCQGDFDNDGDIDGSDLAVFAADFGRTNCPGSLKLPYIKGYSNSGCLDMSYGAPEEYPGCGEDEVVARVEGNSILITHKNATYNCCPDDVEVILSSQGNILTLHEKEILTTPCFCLCCYNIYTEIAGLVPGEYTTVVCWQDWETHGELCKAVKVIAP